MKILALNGSPRGRKSNTERLLQPMLEGAREAGAETAELYLNDLDVRPCGGCLSCWTKTPGYCVQDDDGKSVLEKVMESGAVIWAFPLYCYGVPARVQAMQERMLPLALPHFVADGEVHAHPSRYPDRTPKWVVLSNCGLPEQKNFDAMVMKFRQLARGSGDGGKLVEPIVIGAGGLLSYMERRPDQKEALEALWGELRTAGRELAETDTVSDATVAGLSKSLTERIGITARAYARMANQHWERELHKAEGHAGEDQ